MIFNPFQLKSTLARNISSNLDDTFKTKNALNALGHYKPRTGIIDNKPDRNLFEGIKSFQSAFGLKRDGVMKPGGETERTLSGLLAERQKDRMPRPSPRPTAKPARSLLNPASTSQSIMPGEYDWQKQQKTPVSFPERRLPKQANPAIRLLSEVIKQAASRNEVISENARTVKAALKTSDHRDLAKFHATAVKDYGDNALAEIANFNNQLKIANPKAHNSWLHAFTEELPEDSERMVLASDLGERNLKGSEANDTLSTEKQGSLSEETIGMPPRKPDATKQPDTKHQDNGTSLAADLADQPEFKGIDLEFVHSNEGGLQTKLTIPMEEGKAIGKSGATVGFGVDLGQMNAAEFQRLGDQYDLPQDLIDKLKPYTSKTKDEAVAFLEANPLSISEEEARQLSKAKYSDTMQKLQTNVDKHLSDHGEFNSLPGPVKTVVYDLAINYGPNFLDKHENFRGHLQNDNVEGMIKELRNYGGPAKLEGRRNEEANELEKWHRSHQS